MQSATRNVNQKKKEKQKGVFSGEKSGKAPPEFLSYSGCKPYIQNGLLQASFVCTDNPANIGKSWNRLEAEVPTEKV